MGVAVAHITEPIPSLLKVRPDLPPAFEAVIRKALEKDPAKRYQTASELSQGIKQAIGGMSTLQEQNRTVLEPMDGTMIEQAGGTYVEPRLEVAPPASTPGAVTTHGADAYSHTVPPASAPRQTALPRWLGVGGVALALCVCIGVIGGFASGLIPNPFASPPTATSTLAIAPSETPVVPDATEGPTATHFVPVCLSTTYLE